MEKRQFFRIKDIISLVLKKIPASDTIPKARFIPGVLQPAFEPALIEADKITDPNLFKMLTAIDAKLNLILERLSAQDMGLAAADNYQVNLSEGGICLTLSEPYEVGDMIEIRLMLPTIPYSALVVCGRVERVVKLAEGAFELAVTFIDMEDDVRNVLSRYILQRQRGMLRNHLDSLYSPKEKNDKGGNPCSG